MSLLACCLCPSSQDEHLRPIMICLDSSGEIVTRIILMKFFRTFHHVRACLATRHWSLPACSSAPIYLNVFYGINQLAFNCLILLTEKFYLLLNHFWSPLLLLLGRGDKHIEINATLTFLIYWQKMAAQLQEVWPTIQARQKPSKDSNRMTEY